TANAKNGKHQAAYHVQVTRGATIAHTPQPAAISVSGRLARRTVHHAAHATTITVTTLATRSAVAPGAPRASAIEPAVNAGDPMTRIESAGFATCGNASLTK